ncbi:MAG: mannose-1-phosphate guanylyltransferase [Firmicutes bacterium]|nr:mannose-1-phosphate guanylyltransferase [Bacillota bacterium]
MHIVVVIMAGGKGERFWPRSTNTTPKQFLSLWGEGTLLQQAFARALKVAGDISRVYVITGPDYGELVLSQLPELPEGNLIIEPASRDTAPAVGYAMICLGQRIRDAVMVMMPSDHVVLDEERFAETLRYAANVAADGNYLVTIGIRPTRPEEGYGYIECGEPLTTVTLPGRAEPDGGIVKQCFTAHRARRFTEKPCLNEALGFLKSGKYLWNAGIFVWRLSVLREAFMKYAPALYEGLNEIEGLLEKGQNGIQERFLALERRSIDYTLLEKADNVAVVPGDFGWDDVGTWAALERIFDKDENGNVVKGEAIAIEAAGNIIENSMGDKLFVAFGVKDLVIVNSDDVVLVADKRRSGNLKKITEMLGTRRAREAAAQ